MGLEVSMKSNIFHMECLSRSQTPPLLPILAQLT